MAGATDPEATGRVASLSRPGGNIAGSALISAGLNAKRLQLLREVLPGARTPCWSVQQSSSGLTAGGSCEIPLAFEHELLRADSCQRNSTGPCRAVWRGGMAARRETRLKHARYKEIVRRHTEDTHAS